MTACVVSIGWRSHAVTHLDELWVSGLSPADAYHALTGDPHPGTAKCHAPGALVPGWEEHRVLELEPSSFTGRSSPYERIEPRASHHYPTRMLERIAPERLGDTRLFRCLTADAEKVRIDLNHPLSCTVLELQTRPAETDIATTPGSASELRARVLNSGAGLQGRREDVSPDWPRAADLRREDETDDGDFYREPRFVTHIDDHAIDQIGALYRRLIGSGSRVLDLMSSWISHLPEDLALARASGLGMNRAELEANPRLHDFTVHDLNREPHLPYADDSFDAVICSVSFEYLHRPLEVLAEIARVLDHGGRFVTTFSNRCFPTKAIALWGQLHEFERMGLVAHLMLERGFRELETWSLRGRPARRTTRATDSSPTPTRCTRYGGVGPADACIGRAHCRGTGNHPHQSRSSLSDWRTTLELGGESGKSCQDRRQQGMLPPSLQGRIHGGSCQLLPGFPPTAPARRSSLP